MYIYMVYPIMEYKYTGKGGVTTDAGGIVFNSQPSQTNDLE